MVLNEVLLKRWQASDWLARHGAEENRLFYEQDARDSRAALIQNTAEWLAFYSGRAVQEGNLVRQAGSFEGVAKHVSLLRHECQMLESLAGEAAEFLGKEELEAVSEKAFELIGCAGAQE